MPNRTHARYIWYTNNIWFPITQETSESTCFSLDHDLNLYWDTLLIYLSYDFRIWPVRHQIELGASCRFGISEINLHGGYVLSGYCLLDANGFRCTLAAISVSGVCLLWCFVKLRPNRREWSLANSSRHATDHINTSETPGDYDNYCSLFDA